MKNEAGLSLIELVIALGLLGLISMALLSSMSGASRAFYTADERSTAESLARRELEYVKNLDYNVYECDPACLRVPTWNYELPTAPPVWDSSHALPSGYASYSVNVTAELLPMHFYYDGIHKITVIIYHNDTNPVVTLEGYKP